MKYSDLDKYWQRLFELDYQALCEKSRAIAALIVDENGVIISEGRNHTGEDDAPNPLVRHAETECLRELDIHKNWNLHNYKMYCVLEPCPMCMGTLVMSHIRNVTIAARDVHGGAMDLLEKSDFIKSKNISVEWMPQIYGDIQRAFQTIKELLYGKKDKLPSILEDFSVKNKAGVEAAKALVEEGWFKDKEPKDYSVEQIFNAIAERI